jgi:hypothetical protein
VQWNELERMGEPGSSYTFEVQLYESGQVMFVYGPFSGAATGTTVGLKVGSTTRQYAAPTQSSSVAPDLELDFFTVSSAAASVELTPTDATPVLFYARTASELLPARVLPRVFGPGDLDVTEAMPLPESITGSSGQWVELRNNTVATLNLSGLSIQPAGATTPFIIPDGVYVDAGAYVVLGQSSDLLANGGAPVNYEYGFDVQLAVPGGVEVRTGTTTLGSLNWDAANALQSTSVIPSVLPASVLFASGYVPPSCPRTETYGSLGMYGTPGRANDGTCGQGYSMTMIPGAFIPSPPGSELTFSSNDTAQVNVTLPQAFKFWGNTYTSIGVSTNGLAVFPSMTTSYTGNNSVPAPATPNAVIAPFWDDLDGDASDAHISAWNNGDRYIVSWEHWNPFFDTADLNFQAQFIWATGVIEFHYATMDDTDEPGRGGGNSATIWLESPDGNIAIPFSVNQNNITSNMGIRFSPR